MAAFAGTVEDWLAAEPSGTLLSAVYLDHTRSLGDGLLAQLRELLDRTRPGAVLACTFSTRSPVAGAAWSRAHALHACFSTLSTSAAARGLSISGCADSWPGDGPALCDYDLEPGQTGASSLEQSLASRDLPALAALLTAWSFASDDAPASLRHSAAAVSAAASAALGGGGIAGAVWVPDLPHPIAVLGRGTAPALDDSAVRALFSVGESVLSYSHPGVKVEPARQAKLRRVLHLYWQCVLAVLQGAMRTLLTSLSPRMAYVQVRIA